MEDYRDNQIIKVLSGERFTPLGLARKLKARVILESATFEGGRARYSLLVVQEAFRVYQRGRGMYFDDGARRYQIRSKARDILDVLAYFADQHQSPQQDFPFPAGGIGYLSYEFSRFCDSITFPDVPDPLGIPDAAFLFGHVLLIFDHYSDLLYLIGLNYHEKGINLEAALRETEQKIKDFDFTYLQDQQEEYAAEPVFDSRDRIRFEQGVEKIQGEIIEGNLLQGVLSRRCRVRTAMPALEAYRRLRSSNPAPYLVFLDFEQFQLFAASPETHVGVKRGRALMRPIAGTRRRGASEQEDLDLERDLLEDPKELAEHLMLVDLSRNDLGRVCQPGSVAVTAYHRVERYSRVMHIVSQVEGDLAPGKSGIDALRATFPAGTVSGAPKIQAIETVSQAEPVPRGFYAGVVAYLEPGGNLDSCITIRAGLRIRDELVLQAGAGIVYDSRPEREFEETQEKLSALMKAVGLEGTL
ncbi:anthranilate synthase [Alkalispirochaeta sphaeroplastigenens]|uniref:Anthranilate synthase component 1 n=1 Tax=Alkalispirochaeta sphaeroplastigenens TaxID=1187066 RepID=A0A2S4JXB3_9SPIO|nr:chorismate-binding protein [Alkalispirochaeta sphaeroplastigenens]POR04165.1 anthranilate synthase [Alkalispirochaeta sphaeroplastigenens]